MTTQRNTPPYITKSLHPGEDTLYATFAAPGACFMMWDTFLYIILGEEGGSPPAFLRRIGMWLGILRDVEEEMWPVTLM